MLYNNVLTAWRPCPNIVLHIILVLIHSLRRKITTINPTRVTVSRFSFCALFLFCCIHSLAAYQHVIQRITAIIKAYTENVENHSHISDVLCASVNRQQMRPCGIDREKVWINREELNIFYLFPMTPPSREVIVQIRLITSSSSSSLNMVSCLVLPENHVRCMSDHSLCLRWVHLWATIRKIHDSGI